VDAEGPLLEHLTRRLAECPPDFLAEPRFGTKGSVHVAAVVSDLLRDLGGNALRAGEAAVFDGVERRDRRNWQRTVLVACWLLHDDWFLAPKRFAGLAHVFLAWGLAELAGAVPAPHLVADPDRREELVRLGLKALGLRPAGETVAQAEDRLTTLDSVERQRVVRAALAAEQRARQPAAPATRYAPD
jgi:hypothetical protein